MKNILRYGFLSVLTCSLTLGTTSCDDFLNVDPMSSIPEEVVFSDIKNIEPLVSGLYNSYRLSKHDRDGLMMSNLGNDESQQGKFQLMTEGDQAGLDKYNGLLSPLSRQVSNLWNQRWPALTAAAKAIYALKMCGDESELAKRMLGESSFIRGLLMYELTMCWGEVPIIDMTKLDELGTGRQPLKLVWQYIINDFETAVQYLPENYENEPQRATKGAAYAMLGKVYMSAPQETGFRDFAKADDCFKKIFDMGRYQLLPNFADLFRYDNPNNAESLFELQFDNKDSNHWQFDCGSRAVDAWFSQQCYFSGYDFLVPTPFMYKTTAEGGIWEEGDLRKEESIRYDFKYYTDRYSPGSPQWITPDLTKTSWTGTTDELDPHIKKFEDPRTDVQSGLGILDMWKSGKNLAIIRYADVILLHAECLNELNKTAEAVTIVNDQIRTRAWGGNLPDDKKWNQGMSQEDFRNNIMDERMRELCFEGWRRIDLIRTNKFVELVKARNRWAHESGTIKDFHKRYPIPDHEIKSNDDMTPEDQNPGYAS